MRGTPTCGPYFSIEMVETRVIESCGCSIWTRLSASMSKVMATATLAPLGHGTGRLIMATTSRKNLVMRFDGLALVDRQYVLRAGRHGDDAIHLGAQHDIVAGFGDRLAPAGLAILVDRDVHPQIEG